ncbi:MAG: hypothetical protein HXY40_11055 [Chloroflexi bacterium]|nr:hypothetical protein [Chloroflexota bacterium]
MAASTFPHRIAALFTLCLLLGGALGARAQSPTPAPLSQTYTSTLGEGLTFQYPAGWYVLEAAEAFIISDSQATYTQLRANPQTPMQPGMLLVTVLRPQTLRLGFSLPEDALLDDLLALIRAQLPGITPQSLTLGAYPAYRWAFPRQRADFEAAAYAFDNGRGLYYATVSAASGTLLSFQPVLEAVFASFTPDASAGQLPEIEVDLTLVSEPYEALLAPITFLYPEGWTISESAFGAIQLANVATAGNVFLPPVSGVLRAQITLTAADELPLLDAEADARQVLQFTAAADAAVLTPENPYGQITEFRAGGLRVARVAALGPESETLLLVVQLEGWFATLRAAAFPGELAYYEPALLALAASFIVVAEPLATPQASATP